MFKPFSNSLISEGYFSMKTVTLRNESQQKAKRYVKTVQRHQHQITLDLTPERLKQINKYLRNAERGRLPMIHDGADVTRPITERQVKKFLSCQECQKKPVVFFQFQVAKNKQQCVGLCAAHWIKLSDTVIGWVETER
jgi:hypothetical protein